MLDPLIQSQLSEGIFFTWILSCGFTGSDNQGLFGLEAYYNSILSGTDGKYLAAVDSQGIKLPNAYTDYIEAESGLTLVTTLDVYMQKELEHQLEAALIAAEAQNRVTGIVMQVKTGDILRAGE